MYSALSKTLEMILEVEAKPRPVEPAMTIQWRPTGPNSALPLCLPFSSVSRVTQGFL